VPLRIECECSFVLGIGASRGSESTRHASLDRCFIGGQECVRRADLEMGIRIVRMFAQLFVSELERVV
jgi:hypothetical protein